jgi:endoglucanase
MGVEPNGAYLANPTKAKAQLNRIVENAVATGVYVIIDFHDHNAHLHQAEAQEFFAEAAAAFGDLPNVIYEPFNEPEKLSWQNQVKPYHEALVATIREHDADNPIVLGTPNWSQFVDEAAMNPVAGTNLLYTLHFYACSHDAWLRERGEAAIESGAALFVTEWGATDADGGTDGQVCFDEAERWMDWLNAHNLSWAAWKLDNCPDASCYLVSSGAPIDGGWEDQHLQGHGPFVRSAMQE